MLRRPSARTSYRLVSSNSFPQNVGTISGMGKPSRSVRKYKNWSAPLHETYDSPLKECANRGDDTSSRIATRIEHDFLSTSAPLSVDIYPANDNATKHVVQRIATCSFKPTASASILGTSLCGVECLVQKACTGGVRAEIVHHERDGPRIWRTFHRRGAERSAPYRCRRDAPSIAPDAIRSEVRSLRGCSRHRLTYVVRSACVLPALAAQIYGQYLDSAAFCCSYRSKACLSTSGSSVKTR